MKGKIITYVIMISKVFPAYHIKAGHPTEFKEKILLGKKIHTIRENYELWSKRFEKITKGEAYLNLRQWEGIPYKSKQVEFLRLTKDDGIGIQKFTEKYDFNTADYISKNDGLERNDFNIWFKNNFSGEKAIIHFTKYRY